MAQQGMYDPKGELFGYVDGKRVYDFDGTPVGEIRSEGKRRAIYALNGEKIWTLIGDGIYASNGHAIGYLGSPYHDDAFD